MSTTVRSDPSRAVEDGAHTPRRTAVALLVAAGASFVASPQSRPRGDDLAAMASTAWLVAHLCAMAGFVVLVAGLDRLRPLVPGSAARSAAMISGLGVAAVLPYYGAETFALHAAGRLALEHPAAAPVLASLPDAFRLAPVAGTVFVLGLGGVAVGSVLAAAALWRSAWRSRAGFLLAAGGVLFLPQFFAPPAGRVAHGVLLGAGCVAVAVTIARPPRPPADARTEGPR